MSPKKFPVSKGPKPTHLKRRHSVDAKARHAVEQITQPDRPDDVSPADPLPLPPAPAEPPAPLVSKRDAKQASLIALVDRLGSDKLDRLISYAGHLVGDAPSIASTMAFEWFELGAELSARGPHRLAVAGHAVRAAATGGGKLTPHEEDAIAAWFADVVAEGIARFGGVEPDDSHGEHNAFASAVWYLVVGADWHRDPRTVRPPRCPAMVDVRSPGERGFCASLITAAPGYVRTAIAGASDDEIEELCKLLVASDGVLEKYRPWGMVFGEECPRPESLETALDELTRARRTVAGICEGFSAWAGVLDQAVIAHDPSPVQRIGAVVWLARVALPAVGGAS